MTSILPGLLVGTGVPSRVNCLPSTGLTPWACEDMDAKVAAPSAALVWIVH